jgi:hypothetical protein
MKIYEIRYSQNGGDAEDGPSIATLWRRPDIADVPSDCVVVEIEIDDSEARP